MEPGEVRTYTNDLGVTGLVLLGGVLNHDFVCELQKAKVPFVVVGAHVLPLQVNCVVADYVSGMEQIVTHLAAIGRKRIGFVNGPATTSSSADKYRGFRLGLALHDLTFDPRRVVGGDFDAESGYKQTLELLRSAPDLDAIAFAQDTMALGGLRAIKESGRRVPQDVAVTGFYDYEIARFTDPPLTTVHFDISEMGVIAAQRLCNLIEDPDTRPLFMVLATQLIVRQSG
jgi:LacI family transcriptional regulator